MRKIVEAQGGCSTDNICFALDGSASLSQADFTAQKNFVLDVEYIINANTTVGLAAVGLAAVQYGVTSRPISPLTFFRDKFILAVNAEEHLRSGRTFIRAGILYCHHQMRRQLGQANNIVLISDAVAHLTGDVDRGAVNIANTFLLLGGEICAVGVGYRNKQSLLDIVGRDEGKVLTLDSFLDLSDIIELLIEQICDVHF